MNTWEMASFTAVEINNNINDKSFVVPPYQRGYVWNDNQKAQFIDTLKRGLPFGVILLYHDKAENQHQIIDGLQRCTTIFNFIHHPAPFFNEDDIEDNLPSVLAKLTGVVNPSGIIPDIADHLINWVHSAFQTMDEVLDMQYIDYAYAFTASYPSSQGREREIATAVKPTLKRFRDLCDRLCTVEIPAIVIEGDDDALPEIFERINSRGTQLSKYQIYAATWTKKYPITSSQFCDLIYYNKERYEALASDGVDIADFNPVSSIRKKELNLFEIAYALGKKLGAAYPFLFDVKKELKDVDSLGFSLITACIGIRNSNSKNLHTAFDERVGPESVDLFLKRLLQCVDTAQRLIGKYNTFKLNANDGVGPLHTELQIISLIANIFVARYVQYDKDDSDRLINFTLTLQNSNPSWTEYEKQLKSNAWKRYCLDVLASRWKGAGDRKMDSIIFDPDYYTQSIGWDDFKMALDQWHAAMKLDKREYKRITPPKEPEKIFLAILYLPIFTAEDQADRSKYDVEHLATKNLMRKCLDRYNGQLRLPIGEVGNLCLLPQKENRSKRDKTIYDDSAFLRKSDYQLSELENKFTFTTSDDLSWLNDSTLDQHQFEKRYAEYIDTRFARMAARIKESFD